MVYRFANVEQNSKTIVCFVNEKPPAKQIYILLFWGGFVNANVGGDLIGFGINIVFDYIYKSNPKFIGILPFFVICLLRIDSISLIKR